MSAPAQFLLTHFDRLAEAPGGIAKLRALLLRFAVWGKIAEQNPSDEPAQILSRTVDQTDLPASLPAQWKVAPLGAVVDVLDHLREPINKDERAKRVAGKKKTELFPYYGATQQQGWIDGYLFDEDLVLLGEDGVPFFEPERPKAYLVSGKCWVNNHAHVLRPRFHLPAFLGYVLNTTDYSEIVAGATRLKLNKGQMVRIPVPIPPLAEQRRIVAKVEELMGLCDALEAAQQEREAMRTRLRTSALHQLASPDSDSNPAAFVFQNLPRLTFEAEDLAHLRRSVLELAVAGKLTRQLKSDETAQKLVERMDKARKALVKPPKVSALPEELPSELPSSWTWQPLCALLSEPSQNGYSQSADESPDGVPLLRISAGTSRGDGDVEETDFKRTTLDTATKEKFALKVGDLLAVRFNGNLHFTGKVTIYRGKLRTLQIFPDKLIRLRVWNEFVLVEYVRLAMSAPVIRTAIESFCATTVGNMGISASDLVTVPIPLPPLAEQRRIVAKVDELMAVLDALEAALTTARTTSENLLAATVARLHAA